MEECKRCGRVVHNHRFNHGHERWCSYDLKKCTARVLHDYYGCDSGCCGHRAYLLDEQGQNLDSTDFEFVHPNGENYEDWANNFVRSFWPDVVCDMDRCEIVDD